MNTTRHIYSKIFAHFIAFLADHSLDFTKLNMLITCQLLHSPCQHRRQHGEYNGYECSCTRKLTQQHARCTCAPTVGTYANFVLSKILLSLNANYKKIN
jgi:hypothetical protein